MSTHKLNVCFMKKYEKLSQNYLQTLCLDIMIFLYYFFFQ